MLQILEVLKFLYGLIYYFIDYKSISFLSMCVQYCPKAMQAIISKYPEYQRYLRLTNFKRYIERYICIVTAIVLFLRKISLPVSEMLFTLCDTSLILLPVIYNSPWEIYHSCLAIHVSYSLRDISFFSLSNKILLSRQTGSVAWRRISSNERLKPPLWACFGDCEKC